MDIYIYALIDPDTSKIRYIGATNDIEQRYKQHLYEKTNLAKYNWIKELSNNNKKPTLLILEIVNHNKAGTQENYWIETYKEENLLNINDEGYYAPSKTQKIAHEIQSWFNTVNLDSQNLWHRDPIAKTLKENLLKLGRWKKPIKNKNTEKKQEIENFQI